jgi:two-component system sensor histidine kinase PilS (NtrC family)
MRHSDRDFAKLSNLMIVVRVICAGGALSLIAFLAGTGLEISNALLLAGLLLVMLPVSALWWLLSRSGLPLRSLVYAQLVGDLGLATGIVYFTGGAQSHFTLLYFITILLASIFLSMRGALVTATLAGVLFTAAALLEHAGSAGASATARDVARAYLALNLGLQVACFYAVAALSGYLSRRIGVFGARWRSAASELEQVRTDTRSIIESMSSGFMLVDSGLVVTEFNRAASRMLGVPVGEAVGRQAAEVIRPISAELDDKIREALAEGRVEERGEVSAVARDGREVPLGVSVSLLRDAVGGVGGVVLIFQDLTEVKNMTERVRLADRLAVLGEMSAAIAHEIRTPLASISGSVEMLRDSLDVQGENRRLLELVIKESDRLKSIIDHFLEFARPRPSRLREIALNSVLTEVVYLVRNHPAFNDGIRVELHAPAVVRVCVDEETIKQVFYNLALNAVEAMASGGTLRVKLEAPGGRAGGADAKWVQVTFEDSGPGIDPGDLKRVFQPFFTSKRAGTGLGLAVASKIVQEHGGRIEIKSVKGQGTRAIVSLPLDKTGNSTVYCESDESHVLVDAAKQGGVI